MCGEKTGGPRVFQKKYLLKLCLAGRSELTMPPVFSKIEFSTKTYFTEKVTMTDIENAGFKFGGLIDYGKLDNLLEQFSEKIGVNKEELLRAFSAMEKRRVSGFKEADLRSSAKELEETLGQSAGHLRRALEAAQVGSWEFDLDSKKVYTSAVARRIYGLGLKELTIPQIQKIPLPEYRQKLDRALEDLISGKGDYDLDYKISRSTDGAIIDIYSRAEYDPEKNIVSGTIQDITVQRQFEEKLHRQASVLDRIGDLVIMTDLDGKIIYINEAVCRSQKRTRQELLGSPITFLGGEATQQEIKSILETKGEWQGEVVNINSEGKHLVMLCRAWVVRNSEGRPYAFCGISSDITQGREIKLALRRSEEKYRSYVESAPDGIFICDENGNFLEVNQAACDQTGYSRKELLGMNLTELALPEDRDLFSRHFRRIREEGKSGGEVLYRRKDGNLGYWEISAVRISAARYLGFARDIIERKKIEEKLHKETEAIEASIDGIAILNDKEEYIYLNQAHARIYGYDSPRELLGKIWRILYEEDEVRRFEREIMPVLFKEGNWSGEAVGKKKDGGHFPQEVSLTALDGGGLICNVRDISERKKSEEARLELERRLLHSQKLESLGVMAGGIAHDFNNLLMAILGNLDMALSDLSPVSPSRTSLEEALQAAKCAAGLTRQMLAYSGKGKFIEEKINLSELVKENAQMLKSIIHKNISFKLNLARDLPLISADPAQVQQIVMNLITNAAESIGAGPGRVILSTRIEDWSPEFLRKSRLEEKPAPGKFVVLAVSDTGAGMDRETIARIFEPFFTRKFHGRGLGLSAVLGIVRAHQGAIMVESEIGKGTSILVLLPARSADLGDTEKGSEGELPFSGRSSDQALSAAAQILVVDDEEMVLKLCRRMLKHMGYEVLTARDGEEALAVFRKKSDNIAAVILDLSMPRMDGLSVFNQMRKIDPAVRVILSSGYSRETATGRFAERGLSGFLEKPYNMNQLKGELVRVLGVFPG